MRCPMQQNDIDNDDDGVVSKSLSFGGKGGRGGKGGV